MKRIAIVASLTATALVCYASPHIPRGITFIRGGNTETIYEPDTILENEPNAKNDQQTNNDQTTPGIDMPTLFNLNSPEERLYDRYAACIAATEGLQRYRDYEIQNPSKRKRSMFFGSMMANNEQIEKTANARYIVNSSKVIRALGLSIPQFSRLGREIESDPELKNRITEQAYLYRMAATVTMPRKPILLNTDKNPTVKKSQPTHSTTNKEKPPTTILTKDKYQTFAKTLKEMEYTRQEQIDRLCKAMNIDSLPTNIYNDEVMKVLHPKVKAVYEAFPHQAEEIIRQNGLKVDDFNAMLKRMKSNPIVKWKVDQCLKRELN